MEPVSLQRLRQSGRRERLGMALPNGEVVGNRTRIGDRNLAAICRAQRLHRARARRRTHARRGACAKT